MTTVLVVTASMGAGHVHAAAELARRLERRGARVEVVDLLALAPATGKHLRDTYRLLLEHAPWAYDAAMRFWGRWPAPLEKLVAFGGHDLERALHAAVAARAPDVVVSTYNLASQALGRIATHRRLKAPVVTLMTDPGAHPYWVSRSVDLHLAPLPENVHQLQAMGAGRVVATAPLLAPAVLPGPAPDAARTTLGLHDRRVAVVTAGSWAAGRIRRTVLALSLLPEVQVLVLCGRDSGLQDWVAECSAATPVGWTTRVPTYLAAADVVVDNAGGLTCWEAIACRTPVVIFAPLPGHGRLNAAALSDAGLVRYARSRRELVRAVRHPAPAPPLPEHWRSSTAEDAILDVARERTGAVPNPRAVSTS